MTFDILSGATTVGHHKAHHSLLNSNISKLIHDQGKNFAHKILTILISQIPRNILVSLTEKRYEFAIIKSGLKSHRRKHVSREIICIRF